jgi:hypothetical protein
MTIQFVDLRISNQAGSDRSFPVVIPSAATPFIFVNHSEQLASKS